MNLQRKYSVFINIGECNFGILLSFSQLESITFLITAMVHQDIDVCLSLSANSNHLSRSTTGTNAGSQVFKKCLNHLCS